jgi:hypothetical protein
MRECRRPRRRAGPLHRAGASELVITDDLTADALVNRLSKGTERGGGG